MASSALESRVKDGVPTGWASKSGTDTVVAGMSSSRGGESSTTTSVDSIVPKVGSPILDAIIPVGSTGFSSIADFTKRAEFTAPPITPSLLPSTDEITS